VIELVGATCLAYLWTSSDRRSHEDVVSNAGPDQRRDACLASDAGRRSQGSRAVTATV